MAYVGKKFGYIDMQRINGKWEPIDPGQDVRADAVVRRRIEVECIVYRPGQHRNCRIIKSGLDRDSITRQNNELVVSIDQVYDITDRRGGGGGGEELPGWGLGGTDEE